jgi:hypothetical protein
MPRRQRAPLTSAAHVSIGGGGQARLLRPRRQGWWARTAGHGTCACAAEVGLGPRGLGEGADGSAHRYFCRNHMGVRGLEPEERVWFGEGCLSRSTWRMFLTWLQSCVGVWPVCGFVWWVGWTDGLVDGHIGSSGGDIYIYIYIRSWRHEPFFCYKSLTTYLVVLAKSP